MKHTPAFQFYPEKFLNGTAMMTPEEIGGYIKLLCYQWTNDGIPDDDKTILRLAGVKPKAITKIREKFLVKKDGKIFNNLLLNIKKTQDEYRLKQTENVNKRWKKPYDGNTKPIRSNNQRNTLNTITYSNGGTVENGSYKPHVDGN